MSIESLVHLRRPTAGEPEGLLVLVHGRGSDEQDLFPMLDEIDPERRLLGLTPRGPLSFPPGGAHWYAVWRIGYPDPESFRRGYGALTGWLDAVWAETGIPPEKTVLGGFSQGSVMTYALGLGPGRPRPAAMLNLSGFVPQVDGLWEADLSGPLPRIALGHGIYDDVISVEFARRDRAALEAAGAPLLYRESPLPHAVDPGFLAEAAPWLLETVLG